MEEEESRDGQSIWFVIKKEITVFYAQLIGNGALSLGSPYKEQETEKNLTKTGPGVYRIGQ